MAEKNCIQRVASASGLTEDEAREVLEDISEAVSLEVSDTDIANAKAFNRYQDSKEQIMNDKRLQTRIRQRNKAINKSALARGEAHVEEYIRQIELRTGKPATAKDYREAIISLMAGTNNDGDVIGSGFSAHGRGQAIFIENMTALKRELEAIPNALERLGTINNRKQAGKAAIYGDASDEEFLNNVIRATFGEAVDDADAQAVAKVFQKHSWAWGSQVNKEGGQIALMKNRIPQTWEREPMLARGKDGWVDYILDNDLADDFTFDKRPESQRSKNIKPEFKRKVLGQIYDNIVFGKRGDDPELEVSFRGSAGAADSFEKHRGFYFKNADSQIKYRSEFGGDDIMSALAGECKERSVAVGMMKTFGANPELTISNIINNVKNKVIDRTDLPEAQRASIKDGLTGNQKLRTGKIWKMYSVVSGEVDEVVDVVSAKRWKLLRDLNSLAKLGGAALSAVADVPNFVGAMRQHRGDFLGYFDYAKSVFRDYEKGQAKEILEQAGDFCEGINTFNLNRFDSADMATGRMGALADLMFRMTGLNELTNRTKAGFAFAMQKNFGKHANTAYDDLFTGTRASLTEFGITKQHWEIMQKAVAKVDGDSFITPMGIREVAASNFEQFIDPKYHKANRPTNAKDVKEWNKVRKNLLAREKRDLEEKMRVMIMEETRRGILEPDVRTKLALTQAQQRGTPLGEFARVATQFKSFSVAFTQSRLTGRRGVQRMLGIVPNDSTGSNIAGVANAITSYVMFGYLATSLKDIAAGREPKDPAKLATWGTALAQSGGMGILGDAFFNAESRYGVFGVLAGPTGSTIQETLSILSQAGRGMAKGELDYNKLAERSLRLAKSNLPLGNMWFLRAGMDFALWDNAFDYLNPGYTSRRAQRARDTYGQDYFPSPTRFFDNF